MISNRSLSTRRNQHLQIDIPPSVRSEISLGELIERYLEQAQFPYDHDNENSSNIAEPARSNTTNSIPAKLRRFYSHSSFKNIILAFLSIASIGLCFIGLFSDKLDGCTALAFISSVIMLYAPSPLQIK